MKKSIDRYGAHSEKAVEVDGKRHKVEAETDHELAGLTGNRARVSGTSAAGNSEETNRSNSTMHKSGSGERTGVTNDVAAKSLNVSTQDGDVAFIRKLGEIHGVAITTSLASTGTGCSRLVSLGKSMSWTNR